MNCHLVAVKVGVERGTCQGVQLDCTALHQHRVKGLNAQTVQRRCTVQQNGMTLDDGLQAVPDLRLCTLDHLTGGFDVVGNTLFHQVFHDKGLEQLQSHLLGQTALIHLQLRADNDNGTAGVVNTLAQQVLTEAALLALQHIGQGLQRPVVGAGDGAAPAAVVDEGVHRLLEHPLLIADDDVRRTQLQKTFQTIVTVDNSSVQIIQVRCCKTSTIQLYHRTQIRRNNRNCSHDHPLRSVS